MYRVEKVTKYLLQSIKSVSEAAHHSINYKLTAFFVIILLSAVLSLNDRIAAAGPS